MENEYKKRPEEGSVSPEGQDSPKVKQNRNSWKGIGRYLRYVLFVVGIGLFYIWNSHLAEKQVRKEFQLKREIYDAKANYKTVHARLSSSTMQSVIEERVKPLGLESPGRPPFKILIPKNE